MTIPNRTMSNHENDGSPLAPFPALPRHPSLQVVLAFLPTALYLIIRNLMSVKSCSEAAEIRRSVSPW